MSYNVIGDLVLIANDSSVVKNLENATYLISVNEKLGYHLKKVDPLKLPSKVYGDNPELVDKIIKLFEDEQGRTSGVMLHGAKGTGKTMTAVGACNKANQLGYPVLLLQSQFYGSDFNDFMSKITDSCVVFIDEFEKIFDDQDAVNSTLILLDGAVKTHKLFILTSNTSMVDNESLEYLTNRPSRIFYSIYYGTMDNSVIEEYLDDNLEYQSYRDDIIAFKRQLKIFTIDILKAIVAEVNRYGHLGGSLTSMLNHLNVKTDRGLGDYEYSVNISIGGKKFGANTVVSKEDRWKVGGRALSAVLDDDDEYTSDFMWNLCVPEGVVSHEVLESLELESPCLRSVGDQVDENGTPYTPCRLYMSNALVSHGMIISEQDKTTRAITLTDSSSGVAVEFIPKLTSQNKLGTFII